MIYFVLALIAWMSTELHCALLLHMIFASLVNCLLMQYTLSLEKVIGLENV